MQVRVLRHVRKRYGCPKGDQAPVTAPAPAQVLPKSNASNDLLAMLLVTKYVDGLPLWPASSMSLPARAPSCRARRSRAG
jgi:transposase